MRRWRVTAAGVAAALAILAVFLVVVRQPRSAKIAELGAEADQLRSVQTGSRREIQGLEEVAAREGEFKAALQRLEQLIPSRLGQPALLTELQTVAERAGVELVSVTFGDPQAPQGAPDSPVPGTVLVAMPVTVIVRGTYLGIADVLHRVEVDTDRAVLVGTVAFTQADAGFPQLTGTWSGQAYALLPATDPLLVDPSGKPAQPAAPTKAVSSTPTTAPAQARP